MGKFTVEEINLICCCKEDTRVDTVEVMTAIIPYMEKDMQGLAGRTVEKLNELTEEEFAELVFEFAEEMK